MYCLGWYNVYDPYKIPASSRDFPTYHVGLLDLQVSTASVVYFELQAHEKGAARMLLYENCKCQVGIDGVGWLEGVGPQEGSAQLRFCMWGLLTFTPRKINMEHNHGGLEDHFPFQMGDGCRFQPLIFQGEPFSQDEWA